MNFIELELDSIRDTELIEAKGYPTVLKDLDSDIYLVIWVGSAEKKAIISTLISKSILQAEIKWKFRLFITTLRILGVVAARLLIVDIKKDVYQAVSFFSQQNRKAVSSYA